MNSIYFSMKARVFFEMDGIEKYLPEVREYGRKVLIVSGKSFVFKTGLHDRITRILGEIGLDHASFAGVNPEPTVEDVEEGARLCRSDGCDVVLAVGGGSAMDAAKGIAVLATNPGGLREFFGEDRFDNDPLPVIAVPTTCGTGSEVTRYAVIVDNEASTKKTVCSERIIPVLSILEPGVLDTLPEHLVVATGMDALTHAVESFFSRKADHMSELFSLESLRLLWDALPGAVSDAAGPETRERIFLASLYAGLAINRTGTIILHGMGYSLTVRHGIHHGTANALLLPYVFTYLKERGYGDRAAELEKIWGRTEELDAFVRALGLPSRLGDIGVGEQELDELARLCEAGTVRTVKNMRRHMDRADYRQILESAL